MCEKHYYYSSRDGRSEKKVETDWCSRASRRGEPCENPQKFRHPDGERPPRPSASRSLSSNLPPSPPLSDTSFPPSGSDTERPKHRSGIYINGEKISDVSSRSKPAHREKRNSNLVVVEPPRSPRTPPRSITPVGSPSRSPAYIHEPRSHRAQTYPTYVRPEVNIEVNDSRPRRETHSQSYYRQLASASTKPRRESVSYGSSGSGSSLSDAEARIRQLEKDLMKAKADIVADRQTQLQKEIDAANASIANRPAPPSALKSSKEKSSKDKSSKDYRRPSVSVKQHSKTPSKDLRTVRFEDDVAQPEKSKQRRDKRTPEQLKRDEEEAQRQRLLQRMAPTRSNTAGHSSVRRPTVVYDDSFYP